MSTLKNKRKRQMLISQARAGTVENLKKKSFITLKMTGKTNTRKGVRMNKVGQD